MTMENRTTALSHQSGSVTGTGSTLHANTQDLLWLSVLVGVQRLLFALKGRTTASSSNIATTTNWCDGPYTANW